MNTRSFITIALVAALVVAGSSWLVPDLAERAITARKPAKNSTLLIVGSSLSEHLHQYLYDKSKRKFIENTSTRSFQLGDAWATMLAREEAPPKLTLLELNLYFFNLRLHNFLLFLKNVLFLLFNVLFYSDRGRGHFIQIKSVQLHPKHL